MLRAILVTLGLFFTLFLTLLLVLSLPAIQNRLLPFANRTLSKALGTQVQVSYISISLPDKLVLEGVTVQDKNGLTLASLPVLRVGMVRIPWEFLHAKVDKRTIAARRVELDQPSFYLYKSRKDSTFNAAFLFEGSKDTTPSTHTLVVDFPEVEIHQLKLIYRDSTLSDSALQPTRHRLNFENVALDSFNLYTSFHMEGSKHYRAHIALLSFVEHNAAFALKGLSADFETDFGPDYLLQANPDSLVNAPYIHLKNTHLKQGNTNLQLDLSFENEKFASLFKDDRKGYNHPRNYTLNFQPSTIDFSSIDFFVPEALPLTGVVHAAGKVSGNAHQLRSKKLELSFGKATHLVTDARLTDYLHGTDLFMQFRLYDSDFSGSDIRQLLVTEQLPPILDKLGKVYTNSLFTGFAKDFVGNGTFTGSWGKANANLNLKLLNGPAVMAYEGHLLTSNLNLDTLLGIPSSRKLNFDGEVAGSGLNLNTLQATCKFHMSNSDVLGYVLDTVTGDLKMNKRQISGLLDVDDKQGSFDAKVDVNLGAKPPSYFLVGDLQDADLNHYGITKDTLRLSTIFNLDVSGDSLDNFSGVMKLFEVQLFRPVTHEAQVIRNLEIASQNNNLKEKHLQITSDLLNLKLDGKLAYKQALALTKKLGQEIKLYLQNNPAKIQAYYARKSTEHEFITLSGQLTVNSQLSPLLQFLHTGYTVSANTHLQVNASFAEQDSINLNLISPHLQRDTLSLTNTQLQLALSKSDRENSLNGKAKLQVDSVYLSHNLSLDKFNFQPTIAGRNLSFALSCTSDSATKRLWLNGNAEYTPEAIFAHLDGKKSRVVINDTTWRFNDSNQIEYGTQKLLIKGFSLASASQQIAITSTVGASEKGELTVATHNLRLNFIGQLLSLDVPMDGLMNAELHIRNLFTQPGYRINGSMLHFRYANVNYGDLYVRSAYQEKSQRLFLRVNLVQHQDTLLGLAGSYTPSNRISPLNFQVSTYNLPLNLASPFLKSFAYQVSGFAMIDHMTITGILAAPQIQGKGYFRNVTFGLSFFKTVYKFDGNINFKPNGLYFPNLILQDPSGHKALLNGAVYHTNFSNLKLDLHLSQMSNFTVMDTRVTDSDIFYGKAVVAQGRTDITGDLKVLRVAASLTTGVGTNISIPISYYQEEKRLSYVHFRQSLLDSLAALRIKKETDVLGLNIDLVIDVVPEAEITLVLDATTGEYIRARGTGQLALGLTPEGEFSMDGTYEVAQGTYNLVLRGIQRLFTFERGGTISWNGSVLDAQMNNLTATHRVYASLTNLDPTQTASRPVDVKLTLNGSLQQPTIQFGIDLPNLGSTVSSNLELTSLLQLIASDPQELNRQVFSLLASNSFAPQGSLFGSSGSAATSTAGSFFSSQLNGIFGKAFDPNFQVNVNTSGTGQVNLALNAQLNDRLSVERNGSFYSGAGANNNTGTGSTNSNTMSLGNVTLRYRLAPGTNTNFKNTGQLNAEVFNRENIGLGNSGIVSISRGLGIFYRRDFDTFSELLHLHRRRQLDSVAIDSTQTQLPFRNQNIPLNGEKDLRPQGKATLPDSTKRRK